MAGTIPFLCLLLFAQTLVMFVVSLQSHNFCGEGSKEHARRVGRVSVYCIHMLA